MTKLLGQVGHFDGGEPRVVALVSALQSRAVDGLLERVAGEDAKNNRNAGIELRELHAARDFARDVVKMRGLAAQNAADGDHRVGASALGQFFRRERNFKRTGNMNDHDVFRVRAGSFERIHGARQQAIGNKTIEAADHQRESQACRICRGANFFSVKGFVHVM